MKFQIRFYILLFCSFVILVLTTGCGNGFRTLGSERGGAIFEGDAVEGDGSENDPVLPSDEVCLVNLSENSGFFPGATLTAVRDRVSYSDLAACQSVVNRAVTETCQRFPGGSLSVSYRLETSNRAGSPESFACSGNAPATTVCSINEAYATLSACQSNARGYVCGAVQHSGVECYSNTNMCPAGRFDSFNTALGETACKPSCGALGGNSARPSACSNFGETPVSGDGRVAGDVAYCCRRRDLRYVNIQFANGVCDVTRDGAAFNPPINNVDAGTILRISNCRANDGFVSPPSVSGPCQRGSDFSVSQTTECTLTFAREATTPTTPTTPTAPPAPPTPATPTPATPTPATPTPATPTPAPVDQSVTGVVDGIIEENGAHFLIGWACARTIPSSISIHLYADMGWPGGFAVTGAPVANQPNEIQVSQVCGTVGSGANHRFKVHLDPFLPTFQNRQIFVHAISPVGGANLLIQNSGTFRFPPLPT
ncbi:MAG: hypothetical protein ABL958_05420, partial [Bdellovibrionia bacterium]